ncbi:hypothetical protein GCM10022254_34760 [Actinomadura meridiana]|uniref:Uncharacterized protein n=1 Tax=Actinomadura meridiana TaxID=559626 RepID=A0ABP8C3K2_9ACTN
MPGSRVPSAGAVTRSVGSGPRPTVRASGTSVRAVVPSLRNVTRRVRDAPPPAAGAGAAAAVVAGGVFVLRRRGAGQREKA